MAEEKPDKTDVLAEKIATAVATATVQAQAALKTIEITPKHYRSCFNPQAGEPGYVKPKLARKTMFCGHQEDERQLTPLEISLYNQVVRPGRYHNRQWNVIMREDPNSVTGERMLEIRIPCRTIEDRMNMPSSLVSILQEIIAEQKEQPKDTQ